MSNSNFTTENDKKPNCYNCKWRGEVVGSAHSCCNHPKAKIETGNLIGLLSILSGGSMPPMKTELKVKGDPHGVRNGWFNHPLNFDPVWLEECNGFESINLKPDEKKV